MKYFLLCCLSCLLLLSCSRDQEPVPVVSEQNADKSVLEELREQIAKNPRDEEAWYHLADLYERASLHAEEVDALIRVIEINPGRGYAYLKLGAAYSRLGRHEDAIKTLLKAKKYYAAYAPLYNNLGVAYGRTGQVGKEVEELKKAISLRPSYATARFNLGMAYLKQGNRDKALKVYQELKQIDATAAESLQQEIDKKGKQPRTP
jgi:tetratricopeptide (TPR) repeat protein